jgi:mutual gliding-motility protein MglA
VARIDLKNKVIQAKLVYYGPGLCGKTTNLEFVNKRVLGNQELMSLATEGDRTIFFDYMPFELGQLRGLDVKFKLYTVPGQVRYNETRKMVLKNTDGIVFVADSQELMMDANLESFHNMFANLRELGIAPDDITIVLQYNKRDLPGVLAPDELDKVLNPRRYPRFLASAFKGDGVLETLKEACTATLNRLVIQLPGATPPGRPAATAPKSPPSAAAQASPRAAPVSAAMTPPVVPNLEEVVASVRRLLAESEKMNALLKERLELLREIGVGTRTSVDSLRAHLVQTAKKPDLEALGEKLATLVQSAPRPAEPASNGGALEQRLASLASRTDLDRQVDAITKLLRERPAGEQQTRPTMDIDAFKKALEPLATRAELSALGKTVSTLPSRAEIEKVCAAASKQAAAATVSSQALDQRFNELPSQSDLAALTKRLAELPTRTELLALGERINGLSTKEDIETLSSALGELAEPNAKSNGSLVAKRVSTPKPPAMRAVTAKSWPPIHAPLHVKETMRPEFTYPPIDEPEEPEAETPVDGTARSTAPSDAPAVASEAASAEPAAEKTENAEIESTAAKSEEAKSEEAKSEEAKSEEAKSEETESEETESEETESTETESAEAAPEQESTPPQSEPAAPKAPLTEAQQQNASRIARVMVADLHLYHREAVEEGIKNDDFFERNKEALADMRLTYETRVPAEVREHSDFFEKAVHDFIAKKRKQLGVE